MDEWLSDVIDELGIRSETEGLFSAARTSAGLVADARAHLHGVIGVPEDDTVDVIVFGSVARMEASEVSDFDYLIVTNSVPDPSNIQRTREMVSAVETFITNLEKTGTREATKRPGSTGLFGKIQSAPDLVERIGLEQDTNSTHTRRCLVLQESVSIYHPDLHGRLVESILARYLADYETGSKPGPPRFLLNDLNRYWFTVAVDYQAKRWERLSQGWGIRYLKLLVSRRLSYVGTVLPLLLCSEDSPATSGGLIEAFRRPALARVAGLLYHSEFEETTDLANVLKYASRFNEVISEPDRRDELDRIGPNPRPGDSELFDDMKALTKALDKSLRNIFTGSLLGERVDRYLIL